MAAKTRTKTKSARAKSARASGTVRQAAPRSKVPARSKRGATARKSATASRTTAMKTKRSSRAAPSARKGQGRSRSGEVTIDHDEIRQWVEARGGRPATVTGTERDAEEAGLLRIDFPGYSGEETLAPVDWDDFFEKFEDANLAFLYDTDKKSKFNKFIARGSQRF
jgi:hypothetical protein